MFLCYDEPELVEAMLEKATQFLIEYAKAFKEAGANGIVMAEPAAGLLSPPMIREFSNPYVKRVQEAVEDENFLFLYHNCGTVTPLLKEIKELQVRAYSFGNAIDLENALKVIPSDSLIIGNIDPAGILRSETPDVIEQETKALLQKCSKYPNFVLASGCDIPPQTSMENLEAFFRASELFYGKVVDR